MCQQKPPTPAFKNNMLASSDSVVISPDMMGSIYQPQEEEMLARSRSESQASLPVPPEPELNFETSCNQCTGAVLGLLWTCPLCPWQICGPCEKTDSHAHGLVKVASLAQMQAQSQSGPQYVGRLLSATNKESI